MMRGGGQTLAVRSSHPPSLASLFRPPAAVVAVLSSSSSLARRTWWWSRKISFSSSSSSFGAASLIENKIFMPLSSASPAGSRAEWKRLQLPPQSLTIAFLPLPLLAGFRLRHLCSPRASQASDSSASIDSSAMKAMENKIKEQLNADEVTVKDANGDSRHVSITVVSAAFEGQSAVNRQRMVYKAIWEELQSTVHAVDHMTTRTPAEAAENQ